MSELPIDTNFKSTLPPRKRAKTKEEKEQRRVERILRNRRAAHASREKKRKHVEYLESYVLKLEQNLLDLKSNHDEAVNLLTVDQVKKLSPVELSDLSDLKEKIHSNLNSSVKKDDEDYDEEDEDVKVKVEVDEVEVNEVEVKYEEITTPNKRRFSEVEKDIYYNYLSPISINSPINSPIDLTLKKGPNSYDLLGQNSEVILRWKKNNLSLLVTYP